jgi:HK97 family phage portal protein
MATNSFWSWLGFSANSAISERNGIQNALPISALVPDTQRIAVDSAMQIASVWSCIDRRATTIASLPFFAYLTKDGEKELARDSRLYSLLHESPNSRMTPFEFWRAMVMNHDFRGNAYARLDRAANGEVIAMWPMPSDQVMTSVQPDGSMLYRYQIGGDVAFFPQEDILHLKNLGNGTVGLNKLEFMNVTTDEMAKAQASASKVFGSGGKPTGVLMVDKVLNKEQRQAIQTSMAGMQEGNTARLFVLEASMKYEQLSMSPEQQQLLESRNFSIEEICRWYDVPPVLVHHNNVTTWGSGVEQILDGFYKLTIRPLLVSIEQATRKRVMTARQRATMSVEFSLDALLRGNPESRAKLYSMYVQNGIMTRNEVRQLENWPEAEPGMGGDLLTAQVNLAPLHMLGMNLLPSAAPVAPSPDVPDPESGADLTDESLN